MDDNQRYQTGINFNKLVPFLSVEFKAQLIKDPTMIEACFVLDSEKAYTTLYKRIKSDMRINKEEPKKPIKQSLIRLMLLRVKEKLSINT